MHSSKNISTNDHVQKLTEKQLLQYVQQGLSDEERNAIEKELQEDAFLNDAIEGLEEFDNTNQLQSYVSDLNKQLEKQIQTKKNRKEKRKLPDNTLYIVALCLILVLCILAYYIIQLKY